MNPVNDALTLQFLTFVAAQPRTYRETMEAWRTSCPRLSIWEDAVRDDLVRLARAPGQPTNLAAVVLTQKGVALLSRNGGLPGVSHALPPVAVLKRSFG
jgi:hypothetical protein